MALLNLLLFGIFTAFGLFTPGEGGGDPPADPPAPKPGDPPADPPGPKPADPPAPKPGDPPTPQAGTSSVNVEALQRELNTARSDAGRYRTAATGTLAALAKHLGIDLDIDGKGKFDPEDATAKLQKEIDALRAENRSNALAVGLERVFTKLGANPKVTGPYIAAKVKDLDPKADDFTQQLEKIVQEAIDEEPALRAAQVARRSGGEFNGNGSTSAEVEDPAKLAAMVPRT